MVRIGVAGSNNCTAEHLRVLAGLPQFEVAGIWSANTPQAENICRKWRVRCFSDFGELLQHVDVIDMASPDTDHFSLAERSIKESKHLFIDNPRFQHPRQILELIELSKEAGIVAHVHYPEQYNPAYQASLPYLSKPLYIETQQHLAFAKQNSPSSVITQLMMHDIDLILRIVKANIRTARATAVNVFNGTPDIVNAHLEFDNGAVANLTANRIASKNIHRMKFYQHKRRIQADFLKYRIKILQEEKNHLSDQFTVKNLHPPKENKLRQSFSAFYEQLSGGKPEISGLDHTYQNLRTAWLINEKIELLTS